MTTPTNESYTKPEPVRMLGAITTGLTTFFGGITLVAGLQDNKTVALVAGIGMLVTAAVNAAKDEYVRKNVTPTVDVAAYRDAAGQVVTGSAAPAPEGVPAIVAERSAVLEETLADEQARRDAGRLANLSEADRTDEV